MNANGAGRLCVATRIGIGSSAAYRTAGSMCLVMRGTLEVPSQYPQSPRDLLSPDEAVLPVRPLSIHLRRVGPGLKKGMYCNDREA